MVKKSVEISADEKRWRAEEDAETLARYQSIVEDKNRLREATKVAKQKATDLQRRANAMSKVAKKGNK